LLIRDPAVFSACSQIRRIGKASFAGKPVPTDEPLCLDWP